MPLASVRSALAAEPVKVGFVYISPISDAGWTFQHELGRRDMVKALGDKVQTKVVENVPEGPDAERVFRELAQSGHKIVFGTSFGYMNYMVKVAQQFPNIDFEHCTGYKTGKNLGIYNGRFYQGRYLCGLVAGKMTKSNIIGFVAAFPIPEVVMAINSFIRGARAVNPKAEMRVIWANTWYDPGKERAAADALVAQGADVLTHHTDSTVVAQYAEQKGVWVCSYHSDMHKYAPTKQLTASEEIWGGYYTKTVGKVVDGTWKPDNTWGGIKEGMIDIAPINPAVPADVKAMVMQAKEDIGSGKRHPFEGPVVDQAGKTRVPAGQNISDEALSKMDYYVEGVSGKLPKS
ncbi:MAG: BMP family ABC transporter substrate-binding protein [Proteobacteria bacterium]|nr:BMP family ABC transporter substrate-binding protein [Pseudomonadota bacterium]